MILTFAAGQSSTFARHYSPLPCPGGELDRTLPSPGGELSSPIPCPGGELERAYPGGELNFAHPGGELEGAVLGFGFA